MNKRKKIRSYTLFLLFMFCVNIGVTAQDLYVATNGNDSNDGSINNPLATLIGARDKARSTGAKNIFIRGGRYYFDTTCELGSQDNGISFSGFQDEKVIFDGSKFINPEQFQIVTEDNLLAKLHNNAKGKVFSRVITDTELQTLLDQPSAQISINDKMGTVARFPNIGFAHINIGTVTGETVNESGTESTPKGPEFKLMETIDASKWGAELGRLKKMKTRGYISAEWYKEDNIVHAINTSGDIKLRNGSRYGVADEEVSRLFFYHLLCELDEPGEWYYDPTDSRLYIWPMETINDNTSIGVWAGPQLFEINDGQDIEIKKMTIQNIGSGNNGQGAVNVKGTSQNILVAGITFRFIAAPLTSVNFWHDVKNSKVQSCDFYDVPNNSRLYGGKITSTSVEYGNNIMENCHFTQIYSKDFYGKACGISGAGNIFRNNLIHNTNGQPVTHHGVDHIIELNEAFNVGVEEGDGGAIYTGANLWSHGNVIRHNFIHHIMSIPGFFGRMGVYVDDRDGGDDVKENVFYKGGMYSVLINAGNGNWVRNNVILNGWVAIRSNSGGTAEKYAEMMQFLTTNPTSNDKRNYIGRMLEDVGISGWQNGLNETNWIDRIEPFWTDRYPLFRPSMQAIFDNKLAKPYETRFHDNMIHGSTSGRNFELPPEVDVQGTIDINESLFVNAANLNLKFKEPRPSYAPDIPFDNIGLYLDEYRCAIPDKNEYRQKVKQRFDGQPCHSSSSVYNVNTINSILYYNSGAEIYKSVPCTGAIVETGDDSYTVKATGETCLGKGNGQISIQARNSGSYVANLDGGSDINFTSEWLIENLAAGPYELCITNTASGSIQCYGLDIEAGTSVTGKTTSGSGKVAVNISEGTAPFDVYVNSAKVLRTSSPAFSVDASYGDVVEVKTSVACEGVLSKTMNGIVSVSPNPTEGGLSIALPAPLKNVTVSVYNVYSQLVSSGSYPVSDGRVGLEINGAPAGIYFASIEMGDGRPKVLKIIKK
ncbi:T9SS type A sorting domain-containing protein [Flavivirga algicola]|uniref:T9SS type A sorting domain-containing protein n=1 Tax=Flavivirga algicola TaxID=2729136 RepID=A0ABX1RYH2_9FLAO|nr:T9SS type A sorting domain-containing protein [Flavivirga algicola]NMH88621.1 T9SS type A sorting domain-containing protein [Flavivirga algicola]